MTKLSTLLAGAALAAIASGAHAGVVYSQDFNSPAFYAGVFDLNDTSDRWVGTAYSDINNAGGFTFSGDAWIATNKANLADSALLLNETGGGGAGVLTLNGLHAGQSYTVTYLLSGDNEPGNGYYSNLDANGSHILSVFGVDGAPGTNPGTTESASFLAVAGANTLTFYQTNIGPASPIIDNIVVSTVPEPAGWAMMLVGFGGLGAAMRSRRKLSGAVAA